MIAELYAGNPVSIGAGTAAHELSHLFLNLSDLYYTFSILMLLANIRLCTSPTI